MSDEWCIDCPNCYQPHHVNPPCGKEHNCPECERSREEAAIMRELDAR